MKRNAATQKKGTPVRRVSKKIRKGDTVIAIAGNYSGQSGTVLSLRGDSAVVQGLNVRKRHVRRTQQTPQGGVLELERAIHLSNLQLCVEDDIPVKVKVKLDQSGERCLCYKKDGVEVTYRSLKKQNN